MSKDIFTPKRKNYIEVGEIYFWTATIHQWQRLLSKDEFIQIVLNSLIYLSESGKVDVFAFVIMPNHIHIIWRIKELNGKETVQASFLKFSAHEFKKRLLLYNKNELENYKINASNKSYEFWQRDSLAIHLYTEKVANQKLDYIHYNPCAKHWALVKDPADYIYSTAKFYMSGEKNYSFIKDLRNEF
ncbi:MAG TPA: hypothetical protein PLO81_07925 [Ferruginibacter sp.]|nr:hypothetical protein [Ferruginibacter sp.]